MERHTTERRHRWQNLLESHGMHYHTVGEEPYWDESVYYEFSSQEIDKIEAATYELNRICLLAVQHIIDHDRFDDFLIPQEYRSLIRDSWENEENTIYGRFDLAVDGLREPKLLEYNADTPTALLEAAVTQWYWLQDKFPGKNQFNSIHDRLLEAWKSLRETVSGPLHFAAVGGNMEDFMTVSYLRDVAMQAGWETEYLDVEQIGWNGETFTDLNETPIQNCFKLYPWEWMFTDEFGPTLNRKTTRWFEAPWKALLSNKAILALLWELFPDHPNLLAAEFKPLNAFSYVQKPIFSREGANIQVFEGGKIHTKTAGPYNGPCVYQKFWELPRFGGKFYPVVGSWMINGWASGIGIREDTSIITGNTSRFIPHVFGVRHSYSS